MRLGALLGADEPSQIAGGRMPVPRSSALSVLALVAALNGCASSNPRSAFEDVSTSFVDRGGFAIRPTNEGSDPLASLSGVLDAESVARFAVTFDPALHADLEELGVAQADFAQATRLANPTLFGARLSFAPGGGHQTTVGWVADLLDWIVQPLRKRQALLELEATKLRIGDRLLRQVASARGAFYEAVAAGQVVARLGRVFEVEAAAAELAARQVEAGNLPQLELAQQRSALHETAAELGRARLAAVTAGEHLAQTIGYSGDPSALLLPDSLPEPPAGEPEISGLEQRALDSRFDLAAARVAVAALDRALSLRRATRFSPVGVEFGFEREREADGSRLTGPSLAIQLPLFDLGGASIARLAAEKRRAQFQLAAAELAARSEVRTARAEALALRDILVLQRDTLLPERLRILDETLRRYNMMLVGVYDLLQAKRLEIEAEKATIETWKDYWLARVELERALGGGVVE
jgi:cobalt-zinc-cadmium efflux system outer membrane protein